MFAGRDVILIKNQGRMIVIIMMIEKIFEEKRPVLSFEIFPPKRAEALKSIDETLEVLTGLNPDYISVTFGAGGSSVNNKTVELAKKIKNEYKIEPLVHLTCLHYTREEIRRILDELAESDIYNVLALRGDINPDFESKDDFKYASDLTAFVKSCGNFGVAGACYPETHIEAKDSITDIKNLKKKVDAGADHLISQLFFDNDVFYSFVEKLRIAGIDVPVSAGIMPVINKAQIERMVSLCGATLPEKFRRITHKYEDNREALFDAGMVYAINQVVELLSNDVEGIHLYTMNNPHVAKKLCDGIRNLL